MQSKAAINYIQPKIDIELCGRQFDIIKSEVMHIKSEVKDIKPEFEEIKRGMKELQQKILDRLDEDNEAIISSIIDQTDQGQMDKMLDLVKQILSEIQNQQLRYPITSDYVEESLKVIDDTRLKAADKLKFILPLIIFQYEHEITLEKGVNLSAAWGRVVGWAKGNK
ncbi:hypothetical protein [Candidatus Methanocrinis natronophilus]|uniref:Uncharacterized protein n=1 Tax=Candidatus Methanocrinis natronophilus TaxID=3033396 RepID=A0ABT5X9N8_9EURY|nr:hypothetical protein [Candidatus Methanocrinis natronophilus]MDF0591429.1 hypothetical protein [Candidatus Methanocrinis natronophilus]